MRRAERRPSTRSRAGGPNRLLGLATAPFAPSMRAASWTPRGTSSGVTSRRRESPEGRVGEPGTPNSRGSPRSRSSSPGRTRTGVAGPRETACHGAAPARFGGRGHGRPHGGIPGDPLWRPPGAPSPARRASGIRFRLGPPTPRSDRRFRDRSPGSSKGTGPLCGRSGGRGHERPAGHRTERTHPGLGANRAVKWRNRSGASTMLIPRTPARRSQTRRTVSAT